jgi:F-type H+-transporting ATPase subunit gamma
MAQAVRALTKRIESIGKTRQITRAMKLVAASKMRRAGERSTQARVYGARIKAMLEGLAPYAPPGHPLFESRLPRAVKILLVTGDRGFCGAFNQNVIRMAETLRKEREAMGQKVVFDLVGRKGVEYYKRRPAAQGRRVTGAQGKNLAAAALELARGLMDEFERKEFDEVLVVYTCFVSMARQTPASERLLPASRPEGGEAAGMPPLFEPAPGAIFEALVPRAVAVQVQNRMAESEASEHAARMAAMESATKNASELMSHLTLVRNKMRQAAITSEIVEIVSAAEALNE